MIIGIIGASGRLGSTMLKIMNHKNEIIACSEEDCNESTIENSNLTFLCTPLKETMDILSKFAEKGNIVEVTSVKTPMLKFAGKIISIHPLFGPMSYENPAFKNIIFIDDISKEGSINLIEKLFPGFRILNMNADAHDNLMSNQLVLPYIISIISGSISADDVTTFSRQKLNGIISILSNENKEVLTDTIIYNPYSKNLLDSISSKIDELRGLLI